MVMVKLRNLMPSAKLRYNIPLPSKHEKPTRWRSTFQILTRFLCDTFFELESVTNALKRDEISLPDVRYYFETF